MVDKYLEKTDKVMLDSNLYSYNKERYAKSLSRQLNSTQGPEGKLKCPLIDY